MVVPHSRWCYHKGVVRHHTEVGLPACSVHLLEASLYSYTHLLSKGHPYHKWKQWIPLGVSRRWKVVRKCLRNEHWVYITQSPEVKSGCERARWFQRTPSLEGPSGNVSGLSVSAPTEGGGHRACGKAAGSWGSVAMACSRGSLCRTHQSPQARGTQLWEPRAVDCISRKTALRAFKSCSERDLLQRLFN